MNTTTRTSTAPLSNAQIAMNIVNGALVTSLNVLAVVAIDQGSTALGLSDAVSKTVLTLYGLVLMVNFNTIAKKLFNI